MPSTTGSFKKHLDFARGKYGSDVLSIFVIFFGVAALLIFLSPR